jgi:hypothetical protein
VNLVPCEARDLSAFTTSRTVTEEGFLVAPAVLSKAGNVQRYSAGELGLDKSMGMDSNRTIALYRPHDEVLNPEAIKSFSRKPLMNDHPPIDVTADNWREMAADGRLVGDCGDCAPGADGNSMTSVVTIKDRATVEAAQGGKTALSCGYKFGLDMTAGTAADGTAYDGVMRNIRGNHIAIVDQARGGPACRIGDNQNGRQKNMVTRVIDKVTLQFNDDTQASFVERVVGDAHSALAVAIAARDAAILRAETAEKALVTMGEAGKKLALDHAEKVKELEGKIVKPEAIEALAAERSRVVGDALRIVKDLKPEGKTVPQIRIEVLTSALAADGAPKTLATAILGGLALDKAPEVLTRAAFDAVVAAHGTASAADGVNGNAAFGAAVARAGDGTTQTTTATATQPLTIGVIADSAGAEPIGRDKMIADLTTAWQRKGGQQNAS